MATIMRHGHFTNHSNLIMDSSASNMKQILDILEYSLARNVSEEPLKSMKTFEINSIFQSFKNSDGYTTIPKLILLQGAPGMGKTTLCNEIAYQWAEECLLNDTELVLLIYLRDPAVLNIKYLKDLIHYFYNSDEVNTELSKNCAKILNDRDGNNLTVVLDGFDEFNVSSDSLITNILRRKVLPQCRIVVTSRPTASNRLHRRADVRVEVLGFTDENKIKYIKQELKDYPKKIKRLQSYLDEHSSIKSFCYIPMMMSLLVYVFKENGCLSNNATELYDKFIAIIVSQYLQREKKLDNTFGEDSMFVSVKPCLLYAKLYYLTCRNWHFYIKKQPESIYKRRY